MTPEPTRCAVLGSPITHSLSPALHRAAYRELGLEWTYEAYDVTAETLPAFVAGLDSSWRGLSLTMPLKEAVMSLGESDDAARQVGVGNTLILAESGARVYNTDVPGLVDALRRAGVERIDSAVILGSGATARSVLVSAARLGAQRVIVMARRPEVAATLRLLASSVGVDLSVRAWSDPVPESDLVLATATAGAADARAEAYVASAPVIFDAIYNPWPTVLAARAEDAGRTVVSGLDLLVGQALLQLELMTGSTVPAEVLYDAGRAELGARVRSAAGS